MDKKGRYHASFLSKEEAARESRRTEAMVRGMTGIGKPRNNFIENAAIDPVSQPSVNVKAKPAVKLSQITRVDETNNFAVDYNDKDKLVVLYGKEIPNECPFRVRFSLSETAAVTRLLGKALEMMRNNPQTMRVGEKNSFVVDYDGHLGRTILCNKEKTTSCQFRLAFDEYETMMIIHFLKKARNFFWH